jgi:hypothetical protein
MPGQFQPFTNYRPIRRLEAAGPLPPDLRVTFDSAGANAIVIQDTLGQERARITGTRGRTSRFIDDSLTCKSLGHLLLVNVGDGLLAANLLQQGVSQDERVLWPPNYQEVLTATSRRRDLRVQPRARTNDWGQRQIKVTGRRIHTMGPVTLEGIVYQQGTRLVCVDPMSGGILWVRHDLDGALSIWGDKEFVVAVPLGSTEARVFSMLDGHELGRRSVPVSDRRWTTVGRYVLTWSDETADGEPVWLLKLWDPWTNQDVWRRPFAARSRGCVTEQNEVAIVEPSGQLTVVRLDDGQIRWRHSLEADDRPLLSVHVLPSERQSLVVCGYKPKAIKDTTVTSFPDPQTAPLIDAAVYAFDREHGHPLWQVPARVNGFSLPLSQPPDVPILAFVRQTYRKRGGSRGRPQLSLLCLDRRDGRVLLDIDSLNYTYGTFQMVGDNQDQTVLLRLLNVHNYLFQFSNQPQAPAPPAQAGSVARQNDGGFSNILGAVFDAFGKQVREQGERGEQQVRKLIEQQAEGLPLPPEPPE